MPSTSKIVDCRETVIDDFEASGPPLALLAALNETADAGVSNVDGSYF